NNSYRLTPKWLEKLSPVTPLRPFPNFLRCYTGSVKTDKGDLKFRTLIHTQEMAFFVELETSDGEKGAKFSWEAKPCVDHRNVKKFNDPPNPLARNETAGDVQVCIQPRFAGGEFATAWKQLTTSSGRRVVLSIADSFPGNTARADAIAAVEKNAASDFDRLVTSHRNWWHAFYPKSFVSIPDAKLESFYWIQLYKLACASRPDRVPVDLLGPWYRQTGWPRIWWNLNIQTLYLPVYAANHPELGESLVRFLDAKRANFVRNAKEIYGFDDCATVPHTTCYEGLRGDGSAAPDKFINPGDFTWALHNYYLQYRHTMNHAIVTDQTRHAFYPLLRGSVNLYLRLLKKGDDGQLHLPVLHSPEYGNDADNNYNLSLLRWACQTLISLNARYKLNDPLLPKWRETLANLVAYPVDEHGLRVGATMAFEKSHRHWSHILMVHPLHIMDCAEPKNRALVAKTVAHWLTVDGSRGVYGWSRAAAASLHAALGDGDSAIGEIHKHMADARFVRPNTMYIEGSPVIECSIVLGRSLQDMLIQSWGDTIRVFPAVPKTWTNAVFHNLSAEGAFLVSAERANGKLAWVRLKSLAGEPCRVRPGFDGEVKANVAVKNLGDGVFELTLAKGEEALLFTGDNPPRPLVKALPITPSERNQFGARKAPAVKKGPVLPDKDGCFLLRAAEATIHGDTPRYESGGGKDQIGFWGKADDFVSWDIKLAKPATFVVEVTYSCAAPGSEFTIEVGDQKLTGKSASTGSWATYRTDKLGALKFDKAGVFTLSVLPKAEPKWRIIGLKSVTLKPTE
ncbi:MAG: hypothetical protein NTY01_08760, partial [Verrucomicrobia bacterium]|nr:hypothetical protein [Verrucomicrobiota bacterium]